MGMDDDVSWVKIKTTTTDDPNAPNSSRKSGYLKGVPHNSEAWNSTMSNEDPVKKGKKNQFGTEEFGPFNGGVITDYICTAIFKLGMHPSDGSRWSVEKASPSSSSLLCTTSFSSSAFPYLFPLGQCQHFTDRCCAQTWHPQPRMFLSPCYLDIAIL